MAEEIKLPETTKDDLRKGTEVLNELESLLAKAAAAGIDVQGARGKMQEQRQKLARIKTAFFPGENL